MSKPDHMRWSFWDKVGAGSAVTILVIFALWFFFPTGHFIRHISLAVDHNSVRFVRETPYGPVSARWHSEITLIDNNGYTCSSGGWRYNEYEPIPGNTVSFDFEDWAKRCISAGPPYYLTTVRQVMLFGIFPLRPDRQVTEIQGERPDTTIIVIPVEE